MLVEGLEGATTAISSILAQIVQHLASAICVELVALILHILALVLVAHVILLTRHIVLLISALLILHLPSLSLALALLRDPVHVLFDFLNGLCSLHI